jgi:hypothetical protein
MKIRGEVYGISWGDTRRYDTHDFLLLAFMRTCCYYELDDAFAYLKSSGLGSFTRQAQ